MHSSSVQGKEDVDQSNDTLVSLVSQGHTSFPRFLLAPPQCAILRSLDLSRNRIKEVPEEISTLKSLQILNLNRNELMVLPVQIGDLQELEELHVLSNKLRPQERSLPMPELAALPCLRLLDLRYNPKLKSDIAIALKEILPDRVTVLTTAPKPTSNKLGFTHACDRDATQLHSQLEPISTPTLRSRLETEFGIVVSHDTERKLVMERLLYAYNQLGPRSQISHQGIPVSKPLLETLLVELEQWVATQEQSKTPRERPKIRAEHYMILRSPVEFSTKHSAKAKLAAAKLQKHERLWKHATKALQEVDPAFSEIFTALAVTHNFVGSPHIDTQNIGPFCALALGDFSEGGELCIEANPFEVAYVDTHNKFAKLDGRFAHWVAPYKGTRYSLIFYQTGQGIPAPRTTAVLPFPAAP